MKKYAKHLFAATAVATALLSCPSGASASTDMFLKLGDIKGETTDAKHKGEIDVLSWSWGESDNSAANGRAGGRSRDCFQDLHLTKWIDRASADIILDAVLGRSIPEAKLTIRKAGGDGFGGDYLVLRLLNVSIPSYTTGGNTGQDRLTENLDLRFTRMEGTYTQVGPDGAPGFSNTWVVEGTTCR